MDPAIRVCNVSKCYRVGADPTGDLNLTEAVRKAARNAWRKLADLANPGRAPAADAFWALRDVSFAVEPGEVVGVIGRNGAGKSTLLKLLSRITEPTAGRIEVRGRLGSLLEVATGFHPELTGRENVFLKGSILGMTRREILAKFDNIIGFAEVDQFLDTPVKRYSSGMYVRLAFAVVAHLEPEILIVDEVLAVGDAHFQQRCVDRMTELARGGRTILFVSHNMQLIPRFCRHAVLLERGRVARVGPAADVTREYMDRLLADARAGDLRDKPRTGDGRAKFARVVLVDDAGEPLSRITSGTDLIVRTEVEVETPVPGANLQVVVQSLYGMRVATGWTEEVGHPVRLRPGRQAFECRFRNLRLRPGHSVVLNLGLWAANTAVIDVVDNAAVYEVAAAAGDHHLSTNPDLGLVVCDYQWRELGG